MMNRLVLVVDDNVVSRMLPAFILRPFPAQVIECETGQEAMSMLSRHKITHVLLDISLPEASGIEVAHAIRQVPAYSGVKLVAYTADARASQDVTLTSAHFDAVLIKPIKRMDLLVALDLPSPPSRRVELE